MAKSRALISTRRTAFTDAEAGNFYLVATCLTRSLLVLKWMTFLKAGCVDMKSLEISFLAIELGFWRSSGAFNRCFGDDNLHRHPEREACSAQPCLRSLVEKINFLACVTSSNHIQAILSRLKLLGHFLFSSTAEPLWQTKMTLLLPHTMLL